MKTVILPQNLIGQPDVVAMLQAFYSRSHTSIEDRIKDLTEDNANIKESLKRYWINYGHASIGDCGVLPIFVEGCSMLTAKAIQDNPLYNGQETSSRYVDYSQYIGNPPEKLAQKFHNIHDTWLRFYKKVFDHHFMFLLKSMPEKEAKVKAFDLSRGFIPVTVRTNLSVAMNLRQLRYQLWSIVKTHPIQLVRDEVQSILDTLLESEYKDLFSKCPSKLKTHWFLDQNAESVNELYLYKQRSIQDTPGFYTPPQLGVESQFKAWLPNELIDEDFLPSQLFSGHLDYGSYRDLQRHRAMTIRSTMPSISPTLHSYYLNLSDALTKELAKILADNFKVETYTNRAYYACLAHKVFVVVNTDLPIFKYFIALRSQPTVHQTLRDLVTVWAENAGTVFGRSFDDYIHKGDLDYTQRSKQTIIDTNQQ